MDELTGFNSGVPRLSRMHVTSFLLARVIGPDNTFQPPLKW